MKKKESGYVHAALAVTHNLFEEFLYDGQGRTPFDTQNPIEAPFFAEEEHMALFEEYENQTGQSFTPQNFRI